MKTLTESLKLIQEHIDLQMYGHAWDKCQELIDAVNARDSEPVGEIVEVEYTTSGKDVFLRSTFKNMPIGTKLFTSPQPNQSAIPEGWKQGMYDYTTLFNAIASAAKLEGFGIGISVKAFEEAMLNAAPQPPANKESIDG